MNYYFFSFLIFFFIIETFEINIFMKEITMISFLKNVPFTKHNTLFELCPDK